MYISNRVIILFSTVYIRKKKKRFEVFSCKHPRQQAGIPRSTTSSYHLNYKKNFKTNVYVPYCRRRIELEDKAKVLGKDSVPQYGARTFA